jgi:hypothetical protein
MAILDIQAYRLIRYSAHCDPQGTWGGAASTSCEIRVVLIQHGKLCIPRSSRIVPCSLRTWYCAASAKRLTLTIVHKKLIKFSNTAHMLLNKTCILIGRLLVPTAMPHLRTIECATCASNLASPTRMSALLSVKIVAELTEH